MILFVARVVEAQEEDHTRKLWDSNLLTHRPAASNSPAGTSPNADDAFIGVTLWRFRLSAPGDDPQVRSLIHEPQGVREWTPERIGAATPLREGDKVRISIESARAGYLYVIDRDEYSGGAKGDRYLIFPTTRTRGGDNKVAAGIIIEIPSSDDTPPYFKVERSRANQVAEVLTLLVTAEPLPNVQTGAERLKLSQAQVEEWQKRWKTPARRLEASGQAGKTLTLVEKQAGAGQKRLTAGDPVPQTMYHATTKSEEALLIEVPLRFTK